MLLVGSCRNYTATTWLVTTYYVLAEGCRRMIHAAIACRKYITAPYEQFFIIYQVCIAALLVVGFGYTCVMMWLGYVRVSVSGFAKFPFS